MANDVSCDESARSLAVLSLLVLGLVVLGLAVVGLAGHSTAVYSVEPVGRASLVNGKSLGIGLPAGYQWLSNLLTQTPTRQLRAPARASNGVSGSPAGAGSTAPTPTAPPRGSAWRTGRELPPDTRTRRLPPRSATARMPPACRSGPCGSPPIRWREA